MFDLNKYAPLAEAVLVSFALLIVSFLMMAKVGWKASRIALGSAVFAVLCGYGTQQVPILAPWSIIVVILAFWSAPYLIAAFRRKAPWDVLLEIYDEYRKRKEDDEK